MRVAKIIGGELFFGAHLAGSREERVSVKKSAPLLPSPTQARSSLSPFNQSRLWPLEPLEAVFRDKLSLVCDSRAFL